MKKIVILAAAVVLCAAAGLVRSDVGYPWKDVFIGALEGKAWCGLAMIPTRDSAFAFRFKAEVEGKILDGDDLFYRVSEVGPHSPDGLYARVRFDLSLPVLPVDQRKDTPILIKPSPKNDTLTLEWSRQDERTVIGRLTAPAYAKIHLFHYLPWDFKGRYRILPDGLIQGDSRSAKPFHGLLWTDRKGESVPPGEGEETDVIFNGAESRTIYFAAGVGEDLDFLRGHLARFQSRKRIGSLLDEEQDRYLKKRLSVKGNLYKGVPEAVTDNLFWMLLYQPGAHRLYTPAGRRWIFPRPDGGPDHWTVFAWDSFFNSLELALESPQLAVSAIKAVLETQYPNGNIPNWRGRFGGTPDRSQPPVGAFCVLKLFQRQGDMELLKTSYPVLRKWHAFWKARKPNGQARRDGNGDGLLEWGSDAQLVTEKDKVPPWEADAKGDQRAKWESGQDDLPNWDDVPYSAETGTMTMNCVDLNSLYALDASCLAQIAVLLSRRDEAETYQAEYEKMRELINDQLWNSRENFYFDRFWDGRFSTHKAASNFYPLLARIPDDRRARLMLKHLFFNRKEFWGDYVIPSISRDDPAFNDPKNPDRQYWRGTIWPPTNYLIYQGLKSYGFDNEASEFAAKSVQLFMRTWTNFQLCPENFHPLTGEAAGQRFQSWGPLFVLMAVEEYLDFTPWDGFRFGILNPEEKGTLQHATIQDRRYDVEIAPKRVRLYEDDREIFNVDGGAVVRHFLYTENEVAFEIKVIRPRDIDIHFLRKGKYQLQIDNVLKQVFRGRSFSFEIPEGNHAVLIQMLEALD
jgi:hypothetical protein